MIAFLSFFYLTCFQLCTLPAIVRIIRRRSSLDLSIWREFLILAGVSAQFAVMTLTGASWWVRASPMVSGLNVMVMLVMIGWYRHDSK